jgi:hypothetical protein
MYFRQKIRFESIRHERYRRFHARHLASKRSKRGRALGVVLSIVLTCARA